MNLSDLARQLNVSTATVSRALSRPEVVSPATRKQDGALLALRRQQIKVPRDLSLIGFDDARWAQYCDPPLTVISQPTDAMGRKAATPDGTKSAFNSPGTIQALKFWQDSIQQNVASRNYLGGGVWDVVANLASGYCAMQNVGIWAISALRENAKDFQYGVFPLPIPPGGKPSSDLGGWAFVANAKCQRQESRASCEVLCLGARID